MDKRQSKSFGLGRIRQKLRSLVGDENGVAAIEFAFIAPVLLSLYFVTMEVAQAVESNRKVGRAASMIADLITQQQTIKKSEIDAIMQIGLSIMQPYSRTTPEFIITAIEITDEDNPKVKVAWSRKLKDGTASQDAAPGTTTTVPEKLEIRDSFLVRVETKLNYKPIITYSTTQKKTLGLMAAFDNINMSERYHLRPRQSSSIPCTDC
ncbi:MAG: TadE/TadG family type IV pilus assembly protein [Rhizobiaceae bacterium]